MAWASSLRRRALPHPAYPKDFVGMNPILSWQEHGHRHSAPWRSERRHPPPQRIEVVAQISAEKALSLMHQHTALLWRGDYHQAKQLLAAIKKRVRNKSKPSTDFHQHRMQQAQHSRLFNLLLVQIEPGFKLSNARAPDVQAALTDVYTTPNEQAFLLPLNSLLGFIGAQQWHQQGVPVAALGGAHIHVPFGVFSPLRGEYLDLLAQAPLPLQTQTAWDIGSGSGVLAAILAQRGVAHIIGSDTNPRAVACARANIARLGLGTQISIEPTDLLPAGRADLIVCNPPWLPAKPSADIETALYDPNHAMLHALLQQAPARLNPGGEIWLIMSDLAEHLKLRPVNALPQWFAAAGLHVAAKTDTQPQHAKARRQDDPLHHARSREITSLWRLVAAQ